MKNEASIVSIEQVIESVVGVKLTIRGWTATSKANDVAREVETNKGAASGSCGVDVYYLDYDTAHGLGVIKSQMKADFDLRTLPFEDGGWRIVMADKFMELMDVVAPHREKYNEYVKEHIVDRRDELEQQARNRLGKLFVRFPSVAELSSKFGVDFDSKVIRLDDAKQFKDMGADTVAMIRESEKRIIMEGVGKACATITGRLETLIDDLRGRLAKDKQGRTRYGGLFDTIKSVCSALKDLNITGDAKLAKLIEDTEKLAVFSPEALRQGGWVKASVEKKVDDLLKELDAFGMDFK